MQTFLDWLLDKRWLNETNVQTPEELHHVLMRPVRDPSNPVTSRAKYPDLNHKFVKQLVKIFGFDPLLIEWVLRSAYWYDKQPGIEVSKRLDPTTNPFAGAYIYGLKDEYMYWKSSVKDPSYQNWLRKCGYNPKDLLSIPYFDLQRLNKEYQRNLKQSNVSKPTAYQIIEQIPPYTILKIEGNTPEAVATAQYFARGTKWCTGGDKTASDYLSRGPLIIILKDNESFMQIHKESEQCMDSEDATVEPPPEVLPALSRLGINLRITPPEELLGILISFLQSQNLDLNRPEGLLRQFELSTYGTPNPDDPESDPEMSATNDRIYMFILTDILPYTRNDPKSDSLNIRWESQGYQMLDTVLARMNKMNDKQFAKYVDEKTWAIRLARAKKSQQTMSFTEPTYENPRNALYDNLYKQGLMPEYFKRCLLRLAGKGWVEFVN